MEDTKILKSKCKAYCPECKVYITYKNFARHKKRKIHLRKLRKIMK